MSDLDAIPWERLFAAAAQARARAHAPYSRFAVGAAGLLEDGSIVSGCNVENVSYGLTVCAERNLVGAAVLQGKPRLRALAVVTSGDEAVAPCGACRQVLLEHSPPELPIRFYGAAGTERQTTLGALLPEPFVRFVR